MLQKSVAGIVLAGSLGVALFVGCGGASASTIDGSGGDGGGGSNGGVSTSGGVNPADAGPGGTTTSLSCGNTTCAIPAEVCCITPTSAGTAYGCETGTCALPDAGRGNGGDDGGGQNGNQGGDVNLVTLSCSAQANCPTGTVCCATMSDAKGTVTACQMGASCSKDGIQLCDPAAPTASNGCAAGQQCVSDNIRDLGLPTTFGRCKKN